MADLSDDYKLSFRSTSEIYEVFGEMVARAGADRSIRFQGRKANRAAVLNALIMWLADRPIVEQKQIIRDGMARLNNLLDGVAGVPEPAQEEAPEIAPPRKVDDRRGKGKGKGNKASNG